MKNYFENNEIIIPFSKVERLLKLKEGVSILVEMPVLDKYTDYKFDFEQLGDYKAWLALKQQALENQASLSKTPTSPEKPNNLTLTREQINEIINNSGCFNCHHNKFTDCMEYPCCDCDDFDKFNANIPFVDKTNKMLQEEK